MAIFFISCGNDYNGLIKHMTIPIFFLKKILSIPQQLPKVVEYKELES